MDRAELIKELRRDEDLRKKPYRCTAGKLSIGIGRNLDDVGISEDEALYLVNNDIDTVEDALDRNLPWWKQLSERRQRVLANMCFNMGINKLLEFKNTLRAVQEGRFTDAADGMKASRWARQVGERAERLIAMMKEG